MSQLPTSLKLSVFRDFFVLFLKSHEYIYRKFISQGGRTMEDITIYGMALVPVIMGLVELLKGRNT